MDINDAAKIVRDFIAEKQFPKECKCCGKLYSSFKEYLQNTTHVGQPISYDAENEDWQPDTPLGTMSLAKCPCGTTLAITSSGMDISILLKLMNWAQSESEKRGVTISDLLEDLRAAIDKSVLQDYDKNNVNKP